MGDDEPPLIEVLGGEDEPDPDGNAPDRAHWHTTIRTVAVVVGAVALLWVGSSVAGIRTTSARAECRAELENQRYMLQELAFRSGSFRGSEPPIPENPENLIERARGCGLDEYADLLERAYDDEDEDEDE